MSKKAIILFLFSLIFLFSSGCQPATAPDLSTGTISGQAALPESYAKDIAGYTPIPGATVTLMDAQGNIHTTTTGSNGFYYFNNIAVKASSIIYITKDTDGGGKIVFMEVIPQDLSPEEEFYAGIADTESTAIALVIEALINLGQPQEEIDLEEIISAPGFASLEDIVRQAQENNQDILILSSIITQAEAIADYIINPPGPTANPSNGKSILSYKFEASNNAALSSDVVGTIDSSGHTVSLNVPYSTDVTSLIATFTLSEGASVKVEGTSQVSDTTANDFTTSITYRITAEDNSTKNWIVTVTIAQPIRYVATTGNNANDGNEDSPWETIQYALDTIPVSGTILVQDGTYNESIIFPSFPSGKVITLKSVNGAAFTTIIGIDATPTVTYSYSLEGTNLEGFTITHNSGERGRGIFTDGPSFFIIKNCTISNNDAEEDGGGIYHTGDGSLTIINSSIIDNDTDREGAGIKNTGTLSITDSTLSGNHADNDAGGIRNTGILTLTGTTVSDNRGEEGGAIDNSGTLTINTSTISGNQGHESSGAIDNSGILTINDSIISENDGMFGGGGIYSSGNLTITNSTISNNSTNDGSGGGIKNNGTLIVTGSTISGNTAKESGGGIYYYYASSGDSITITGSTISGNSVQDHGGGIYLSSENNVTIGGSNVTDVNNFNTFTDNFKIGDTLLADQHIRNRVSIDTSIDCHANYPNNNFTPGP